MSKKNVELVITEANKRYSNSKIYTEDSLRNMADNKLFFYDEKNKRLMFRGKVEDIQNGLKKFNWV